MAARNKYTPLALLTILVLALLAYVTPASADVTVAVRADAHVQSNTPTTNYETAANMVINDATADRYAFVKVDIPALPAGETQDQGVLTVQLNANDPAQAILENAVVKVDKVTNVWQENNLTWDYQPAVEVANVGSVAFTGNGTYDIPVGTVVPGSTASYRLTSTFGGFINIPSQENTAGGGPTFRLETTPPPPSLTWPPAKPYNLKIFGMSAPENEWAGRLNEVGRCGIEARRIFVPDMDNWASKFNLVQEAIAAGMTPVISFKPGSGLNGFLNGLDDAKMAQIKADLLSTGTNVTATWWHEPNGDMTHAQFHQGSQRFFDHMNAPSIAVGPIINGWLLDNGDADFTAWTTPALMDQWEFLGTDTYQAGTDANPDATKPGGRAVPLLDTWLNDQGKPDMPILVGEYNGWTAESIDYGGDQLRFTDNLWIGLVWNSGPTGLGKPLEGARLTEYIEDKAAPEVKHEEGC